MWDKKGQNKYNMYENVQKVSYMRHTCILLLYIYTCSVKISSGSISIPVAAKHCPSMSRPFSPFTPPDNGHPKDVRACLAASEKETRKEE